MSIVLAPIAAIGRCLCGALALLLLSHAAPAQVSNVLVLYSNNRLLPANVEADRGLRETAARSPNGRIEIFDEFLDRPAFSGPEFDRIFAAYLRDKYAERPPSAIVVFGFPALDFMLRHRVELFTMRRSCISRPRTPPCGRQSRCRPMSSASRSRTILRAPFASPSVCTRAPRDCWS
jgi:hypothetical protein